MNVYICLHIHIEYAVSYEYRVLYSLCCSLVLYRIVSYRIVSYRIRSYLLNGKMMVRQTYVQRYYGVTWLEEET